MRFKTVLLGAIASMGMASIAQATPDQNGWYVGLEGGWVNVLRTDLAEADRDNIRFHDGWGALGTVGYAFYSSHWRLEAELGYRSNGLDTITDIDLGVPVTSKVSGSLHETSGFLNAIYDIPLFSMLDLSLGGGVGVDRTSYRDNFNGTHSSATSTDLALQGIAGLTWRVGQHWDIDLNYRYLWVQAPVYTLGFFQGKRASQGTGDMDIRKNTVTIGFRYGFDNPVVEAPPPPPPPPPPAAPRHFIIFFGFNKCNITAEADSVLSEAASAAKSMGSASVTIVGHTDTVGSPKYNQFDLGLGQRRNGIDGSDRRQRQRAAEPSCHGRSALTRSVK